MTDEQIMQGLIQCFFNSETCGKCPYKPYKEEQASCLDRLGKDAFGFIRRQQITIEQLEAEVDTYVTLAKDMHNKAIKEFAEKLKAALIGWETDPTDEEIEYVIDRELKEMAGADNV